MANSGNERAAFRRLRGIGLTAAQAAGAVGSLTGESGRGLNPSARNPSSGAIGFGQWLGGRAAGVKPGDFEGQLNHLVGELKGSERGALAALKRAKGPREAAEIFTRAFERPSEGEIRSSLSARQAAALDILRKHGGDAASQGNPSSGSSGTLQIKGKVTPAGEAPDFGTAAAMVLRAGTRKGLPKLGHLGGQSKLAQAQYLLQSGQATKHVPVTSTQSIAATKGTTPAPRDGEGGLGTFHITGPNPKRLQPVLVGFARKVAGEFGEPLTGSDGTGHSRLTVNGNVSQHTTGNATDIPATGTRLIHMGQAALIAAGMPPAQARKQKGGLYNVGSHQIIFNTHEGGDHTTHLHISAR